MSTTATLPNPLALLAAFPNAAIPVADLPAILGLDDETTATLVAELLESGDLLQWTDHPDGPSVILSTDAAERFGLELTQVFRRFGDTPTFRWLPPSSKEARRAERKARRAVPHLECEIRDRHGNGGFDDQADENAPDPLRSDLLDERPKLRFKHADTKPRLLLGMSWIWPIAPTRDGSCRVCRTIERMPRYAVCLHCCRSGSDDSLAEVADDERPRPSTPVLHDGGLEGGRGKAEPKRRKGKKAS